MMIRSHVIVTRCLLTYFTESSCESSSDVENRKAITEGSKEKASGGKQAIFIFSSKYYKKQISYKLLLVS